MARRDLTFRVFISSTFSDMTAERNALQAGAFPRLRAYCEQRGARFQAVDLRWGVSTEASRDQQTMRICLQELARCRRLSPRPNFLVLLGDRYGWRPLPAEIGAAEFERLCRATAADDEQLLRGWYLRDDNAVPPVYWLRPRFVVASAGMTEAAQHAAGGTEAQEWQRQVEPRLRKVLAAAAGSVLSDEDPDRQKYECSATHQEIRAGALTVDDADKHVLCYFRTIDGLPCDERAQGYRDLIAGQVDEDALQRMDQLKEQLRQRLPAEHVYEYAAEWQTGRLTIDAETLCERVFTDLRQIIDEELAEFQQLDETERERRTHQEFGGQKAGLVLGRAAELARIAALDAGSSVPMLIHGPPGSGKTALVARAWTEAAARHPHAVVAARFCGVSPGASSLQTLLESVLGEIAAAFGDERPLPAELHALCRAFPERLEVATAERPLLLFLDALDQLHRPADVPLLAWLPRTLPPHVQVMISAAETDDGSGEWLRAAEQVIPPSARVPLGPLGVKDAAEILATWLREAGRALQPEQLAHVLGRFSRCPYPLFLRLAFEEARRWHSDDGIPIRADGGQGLGCDTEGLVLDLLSRLSQPHEHGPVLTGRSLRLLAAARHGLAEDELIDVLSADRRVMADFRRRSPDSPSVDRLPTVVWSRLYAEIEPYLAAQRADGAVVMAFYHRQIHRAVERSYLAGRGGRCAHWHLARYFQGRTRLAPQPAWFEEADGARRPNRRKTFELPYQLCHAQRWRDLEAALTDLPLLEAKADAGQLFDLCEDYRRTRETLPPGDAFRRTAELLEEALRRETPFLSDHPEALFQCLWNSGWWYDCPVLPAHYDPPPDELALSQTPQRLYRLLERWRDEKELSPRPWIWCRSLCPPAVRLGTGLRAVLRGHLGAVNAVAFTHDGRQLVSAGNDGTVRFWDLETGIERAAQAHTHAATCLATSAASVVAVGFADGMTALWIADEQRAAFSPAAASVTHVGLSSPTHSPEDPWLLVTADAEGRIALRNLHTGAVQQLGQDPQGIRALAFSPVQSLLALGSGTGHVTAVHLGQPSQAHRLQPPMPELRQLVFSVDGTRLVAVAQDTAVRVWELETRRELPGGTGERGVLPTVAVSPNGELVAAGVTGGQIRVWQARIGVEWSRFHGHEADVTALTFSPDGGCLASADRDGTVRVWDMRGDQSAVLVGHDGTITALAAAAQAERAASAALDGTVRIWNTRDGTPVTVLHAREPLGSTVAASIALPTWSTSDWKPGTPWHVPTAGSAVPLLAVALSRDAAVAAATSPAALHVWDVAGSVELHTFVREQSAAVRALVIADQSRQLIGGDDDGMIRGWSIDRGTELFQLSGHRGRVQTLFLSADERQLTSTAQDGERRLWDLTRLTLTTITEHLHPDDHLPSDWWVLPTPTGTGFQPRSGQAPVAWCPLGSPQIVRSHARPWVEMPSGRTWVGGFGSCLAMFSLEYSLAPSPPSEDVAGAQTGVSGTGAQPTPAPTWPRFEWAGGVSIEPRWDDGLTLWVAPGPGHEQAWIRLTTGDRPDEGSADGWYHASARWMEFRPARLRDRVRPTGRVIYRGPLGMRLVPLSSRWRSATLLWPAETPRALPVGVLAKWSTGAVRLMALGPAVQAVLVEDTR